MCIRDSILAKKIHFDDCNFELITPSEYIDKYPTMQISNICRSSWGANGYSYVWLNQSNDYIHKHLHTAAVSYTHLLGVP